MADLHRSSTATPTELHHQLPPPFDHSQEPFELIAQGAESLLFRTTFLTGSVSDGRPAVAAALKVRPKKAWRHPTLDKRLTRARILAEARVLVKFSGEGIATAGSSSGRSGKSGRRDKVKAPKENDGRLRDAVPNVLGLDWEGGWLATEWIEGPMVKKAIYDYAKMASTMSEEGGVQNLKGLLRRIGAVVGRLHAAGVVHGDLTTSNLMLRPHRHHPKAVGSRASDDDDGSVSKVQEAGTDNLQGEIVLIDFGLSSQSISDEDRAVDLYVLERAFGSTHPREEHLFPEVIAAYQESMNDIGPVVKGAKLGAGDVVVRKLEDVRMRGRKKSMIG
ncbi:hypothetical protein B0A50_08219 [Salinomyces thailandicus]|uniref:EKC/KEOPS complex subunit BUD32 n=1 Tax=Salinomyces thailandicus TaxID=706561 RepID=A0A4U0TKE2_9PEZI|nr:hypothetical protein B0A50_08219 [Salinomyces thailandica]